MWKPWERNAAWNCNLFSRDKYRCLYAIDCHTAGEPTRIIIDGVPLLQGKTMAEKKQDLESNYDYIRTIAMHEPRGHRDMFGSVLVKPTIEEADFGIIFMDGGGYLNMCGHGTIGAAAAVIETGMIEIQEPYTRIVFETPAGIVTAKAKVKNRQCQEVSFVNVPAFVFEKNLMLQLPGIGKVQLDIAFGGSFFAVIDAREFGVELLPDNVQYIMEKAILLRQIVNNTVQVCHPEKEHIKTVDLVEIYGEPVNPDADKKNMVIFGAKQFDRSPCGTGTCAKLALLYSKDELGMEQPFVYESIIGTRFVGRILGKTRVGNFDAIIPEITGSAYITGCNCLMVDPEDSVGYGFIV